MGYCTVEDIEGFLNFDFTDNTNPNTTMVQNYIDMASAEIDRYTNSAWEIKETVDVFDLNEYYHVGAGRLFMLTKGPVKDITKVEVWTGRWQDITNQEGRNFAWWCVEQMGQFYLRWWFFYPWGTKKKLKITYTYGHDQPAPDIKMACIMLSAAYILTNEDRSLIIPKGTDNVPYADRIPTLRAEAYKLLDRHRWVVPLIP